MLFAVTMGRLLLAVTAVVVLATPLQAGKLYDTLLHDDRIAYHPHLLKSNTGRFKHTSKLLHSRVLALLKDANVRGDASVQEFL